MDVKVGTEQGSVITPYLRLIQLEKEVRHAPDDKALGLLIVNRIRQLIPCKYSLFFTLDSGKRLRLSASADTASVEANAPFVRQIEAAANAIYQSDSESPGDVRQLDRRDIPVDDEFWSARYSLWVPMIHPNGTETGVMWMGREQLFTDHEKTLSVHLSETFSYAWQVLKPRKTPWLHIIRQRPVRWVFLVTTFLLMLMPVRLTVLAPAEVVAREPFTITAPISAVVERVLIQPNQKVIAGEPLLLFESTELRNQVSLAREELAIAEAELRKSRQLSFTDSRSTALVAELNARRELMKARLEYAEDLLNRSSVKSPEAGIAVFRDSDDWNGRPVNQGERILYVANPMDVELNIALPARDAITLAKNTEVKLFLDINPLEPLTARITHASYEAEVTPEGLLAYRLIARLDESNQLPRIGLRGTAKLYGEDATLFFYLFRRPLTFLRQWLGL